MTRREELGSSRIAESGRSKQRCQRRTLLTTTGCGVNPVAILYLVARWVDASQPLRYFYGSGKLRIAIEQQHEHKELRFQDGEIRPALQTAIELCADRAAQKQMTITLDCPAGARSRINADLLEQAAVNLIENAIKYSEPGRPIHIAAAPADGGWRIDFTDHGNGIEPQHLDRIFERFYRVDKSRSRSDGGTGLGLSIVKHIMSAHNGRVTVTSQYGQGSTFTLHLPASPAQ